MNTAPTSNLAMLAEIFRPRTSWGQKAALADRNLQLQFALTQQEQQKELQLQAADAQIAQFQAEIAQNDFVGPDQMRVGGWLKNQEKTLAKRLKEEYQGDVAKFMKTEGPSWMQSSLQQLKNSPEYKQAVQNRLQVGLAQKAVAEGQTPVGRVVEVNGKKRYISADQDLLNFYDGKTPTFTFLGAYKPEDDLKELRDTFAPGKSPYERTPVSEEEKLNFLLQKYPERVALDKYYQQHSKSTVFYKTKPLDELIKFQQDQAKFRQGQAEFGANMKLKGLQMQGAQLSNALKMQKLQEVAEANDPATFLSKMMGVAVAENNVAFDKAGNKKLKQSGIDLNAFQYGPGAAGFNAIPVYGAESILAQRLNLTKTKEGYTGQLPFKEAVVEQNGFNAIDLSKSRFQVVGLENKVLFNQNNPDAGFARVRIRFADDDDAAAAGLIMDWNPFDFSTKTGSGVYDKSSKEATVTVPIGSLRKDKNFWHGLQKSMMGTKAANESIDSLPAWGID